MKRELDEAEAVILTNGLGQAVAFLSQENPPSPLLAALEEGLKPHLGEERLLERIRGCDSKTYLALSVHSLEILRALRANLVTQ